MAGAAVMLALTSIFGLGLVIFVGWAWHRTGAVADGGRAWRLMLAGVAVVAVSAVLMAVVDALGSAPDLAPTGAGDLGFTVGCVLACGLFYDGLVLWNRTRMRTNDPREAVNGLSAVLVGLSWANLLAYHVRPAPPGITQWQLQASLWACTGVFILLG